MAFQAIQTDPFLGQGFGQELNYLTLIGSEGRAHNAYLTVWLELGLGGLLLFLAAIFQFVRAGCSLYGNPRFQLQGALILALIFALGLDSLGFVHSLLGKAADHCAVPRRRGRRHVREE